MAFCYTFGAGNDCSEKGRVIWARVRSENDLRKFPFKPVYAFRPGMPWPTKWPCGPTPLRVVLPHPEVAGAQHSMLPVGTVLGHDPCCDLGEPRGHRRGSGRRGPRQLLIRSGFPPLVFVLSYPNKFLARKRRASNLAELAVNLSANCPQSFSVVEVQRHTDERHSFESHPLRHFRLNRP
jgi:hypothetical protein